MDELKKNQIYTVQIEGYSSEAYGVCRIGGRAVFVPRALVGETWRVRIVKLSASAVYARGEELLVPSPERRESDCPYFGKCGGCDCRHMSYNEELRFKLDRVNAALRRIGKQTVMATEILGSETLTRYRNKGIFAVAEVNGQPVSGFFRERTHELIPVARCLIQNELSERAAQAVTAFMRAYDLPAYDEQTGGGTVRHVFCRSALRTHDAVVCVVSARGLGDKTETLVRTLRDACPELSGIVLNINKTKGNTVLAGDFYTLWGKAEILDELCRSRFSLSPQAFFQINPPQAERLYGKALACAQGGELAFDLYCGAGTISLCLARQFRHVIGAEIVPEAVENARENARENGVENVEFLCADAGEAAQELEKRGLRPDVIVVDPPRKGMSENAVRAVCAMGPERVVYVSCNPATLARDVLLFSELGYALREVTAVDMFPRTAHVETVACLSRKDPRANGKEQIERIMKYEGMMREAQEMLETGNASKKSAARLQELMSALDAYYSSEDWKRDYADEEAGLLPTDLKRGVLSQDGIWNLLETFNELMKENDAEEASHEL